MSDMGLFDFSDEHEAVEESLRFLLEDERVENQKLRDKIREMEEEHARLINRYMDLQDRLDTYISNDPTI